MRLVIQRVSQASVEADGEVVGRIGLGMLVLVGAETGDDVATAEEAARKVAAVRIFEDAAGKMNLGLAEVAGGLLVISQFTLYGDAVKGRRPSFIDAARPETAIPLYERFVALLRERVPGVETGEFGAMMDVELVNDGPVTLILER